MLISAGFSPRTPETRMLSIPDTVTAMSLILTTAFAVGLILIGGPKRKD
jgi:hypothetical protein